MQTTSRLVLHLAEAAHRRDPWALTTAGMLDRATWRRFQIRLKVGAPGRKALTEYFESRYPEAARRHLEAAAAGMTLEEASYAEAAEFCDDVEPRRVLFPDEDPDRVFRYQARPLDDTTRADAAAIRRHQQRKTHDRFGPARRPGDAGMNDEPIKAAELVRNRRSGLSRYSNAADTLTELSGLLEDVQTTGEDDAWIVVRPVDALPKHDMATATIRKPTVEIDLLLEGIGRDGRITLVGMAAPNRGEIAKLRMTDVRTINGVQVNPKRR